jgi:flagellar assembly protein FliH
MSSVIKLNSKAAKPTAKISGFGNSLINIDDTESVKRQLDDYYNRGLKDGQEKARRDLEQSYMDRLAKKYEELYTIFQQYDEHLVEYDKSFEELVIETAYELARKILQHEIQDKSIVNENVRLAISKIIGANEIKLKLNPKDLDQINDLNKNILSGSSFSKIKIESDERIEAGGCLVETEIGNVDARISTQLYELKKQLEDNIDNTK